LELADEILSYDLSSGSCSGSHYRLKELLSSKQLHNKYAEVFGKIRWTLRTGAKHTILTGTSIDNTLFIVDLGQAWQSEQSQLGSANSARERAEPSGDSQARDRA
jgi:hypothetical protein